MVDLIRETGYDPIPPPPNLPWRFSIFCWIPKLALECEVLGGG
jgi:hypothetical protein